MKNPNLLLRMSCVVVLLATYISGIAQTVVTVETIASDEIVPYIEDIEVVRQIKGGTVFQIKYEGSWTLEMKGAFEYACKIWEEQMPTTLPINITAKIAKIRSAQSNKVLSKVSIPKYESVSYPSLSNAFLLPQAKAVLLIEDLYGWNHQFVNDPDLMEKLQKTDIEITYNSDMLSELSYSLSPDPDSKYDFITLVLRDIAKGLGFFCDITADVTAEKIRFYDKNYYTPFESIIMDKIGSEPYGAYSLATQGTLPINIKWYGTLNLYAPNPFQNGVSLNTFIPNKNNGIESILSADFSKGTVLRNLKDDGVYDLFEHGLMWQRTFTTSSDNDKIFDNDLAMEQKNIPYNGDINISSTLPGFNMNTSYHEMISNDTKSIQLHDIYSEIQDYIAPYRNFRSPNNERFGWTVSFLLKSGKWDRVYFSNACMDPLSIKAKDLEFHYESDQYARTCDGMLRGRICNCRFNPNKSGETLYYTTYYAYDYLPQKIEQEFNGVIEDNHGLSMKDTEPDDYFRDIKIAIKNLEGAETVY